MLVWVDRNGAVEPTGMPVCRWLAYESDETGTTEIYVRPYPDVDSGKWQVSGGGGILPQWAADGSRLYFIGSTHLMEAETRFEPAFRHQTPTPLFEHAGLNAGYRVTADSERFLMSRDATAVDPDAGLRVIVVLNWTDELERFVPVE